MKCEVCKFYLTPRWCDKFDFETDPEKECNDCPEATVRVTVYDEQLSDYD